MIKNIPAKSDKHIIINLLVVASQIDNPFLFAFVIAMNDPVINANNK